MGRVSKQSVLVAIMLAWLGNGCLHLRPIPLDLPAPPPSEPSTALQATPTTDAALSGALDGPTLRLALRDLAVILDTLGRLEQVRPDLKSQMLRELADADAATAAAVVKRWRTRLPELQAAAEKRTRTASLDSHRSDRNADEPASQSTTPITTTTTAEATDGTTNTLIAAAGHESTGDAESIQYEDSSIQETLLEEEPPNLPSWDDLLESLLGMTRDRSEQLGPDAVRARIQLALLDLVRRSQEGTEGATMPDPQLWTHLDPAIQYCFGNAGEGPVSPQEVARSLQVATELLRGPGRFQVRGLAFCTRIRGFGNIDRLDAGPFRPGQPVLLYSEVEHFFSEPESGGFRTRISSVIELLDASGRILSTQPFAAVEDSSSGPRRDYFLSFRFHLPQNLKPGVYSVRLTLRDELANRSASGAIALSIR